MGQHIPVGDLPRVTDRLEKQTGKLLGVLYNVHEEVQRIGKEVREDYEAKLAEVVQQYDEHIAELQYRIDGYEEENRRTAALLRRRVVFRAAVGEFDVGLKGAWVEGTLQAFVLGAEESVTYEVEVMKGA